jgi:hypothetical protein
MSAVPYTFANDTGNIALSELDVNFANVKARADTAVVVTAAAQPNITSVGTLSSLSTTGNISTAGFFVGNGSALTGIVASNANAAQLIGNTLSSNVVNSSLTAVGTLNGLNVNGTISSTGTITGAFIVGNGAGLTGVIATGNVSNAVYATTAGSATFATTATSATTATQATYATTANSVAGANVSGTVANATYAITSGFTTSADSSYTAAFVTSNAQSNITSVGTLTSLSVTGNISGGNIRTAGVVSATGNITGNYFIGNGSQLTGLGGPTFMANVSTGQGVPTSPSTISQLSLVYDNVIKNVNSGYNATTGIFTAPITGYYQVSSSIGVTPSNWAVVNSYSSAGVIGVYKNGNPIASGPYIDMRGLIISNTVLQVTTSSSISVMVYLDVNDTLNCKLAYLTTAPTNFWNTSTNLIQGYFQAVWIRGA